MSGTNGVLDGVNGAAASALSGQLQDALAEKEIWRRQAGLYLADYKRIGEKYLSSQDECCRLAAELATVQAECCRLTDVNGDLGAAHERLMGAALGVLQSGIIDSDGTKAVVAAGWFDRLMKAVNGDLIDPEFEPDAPDGPIIGSIDAVWFARLGEAINRLNAAFSASSRMTVYDEEISDVLEAWGDKGEGAPAEAHQSPEPGVNARLLAAAKAVQASADDNLTDGNYNDDWTGVDDDALVELLDAINAAQEEGESAESAINGVGASDIIREQSERIKTLELELEAVTSHADEARRVVRIQGEAITGQAELIESLGRVEAAAREIRAEYATIPRDGWRMHRAYNALDFALDGLPKGGEAAPCQATSQAAPCGQPCGQSCQPQAHCPERVHMLAVAARNLILAWRKNEPASCHVHALDFALDGLI